MGIDQLRGVALLALAVSVLIACDDDRTAPSESDEKGRGTADGAIVGSGDDEPSSSASDRDGGAVRDAGGAGSSAPAKPDAATPSDASVATDASMDPAPSQDAAMPAADAAAEPEPPATPPMNGDQLSLCDEPKDCDKDLGCYDPGPGQGFCTAACEGDDDCADLEGADYSCSDDGLCEIECNGGPPAADVCPDGLVCMQIGEPGQGGLRRRCAYSPSAGTDGRAFSRCSVPADCGEGLQCFGARATAPGYCTRACTEMSECRRLQRSGEIAPTCVSDACVLDCAGDHDACPQGMTCIETPPFWQCMYP